MIRTLTRITLVALGAMMSLAGPVDAAPDPPAPVAVDTIVPPPAPDNVVASDSLIQVPPGCSVPDPADVAFVGTVVDKDGFIEKGTVRFQIGQVRAGDVAPFAVGGLIDIRYGPDSQFLDIGEDYLVSAAVDPAIAVLASKVAPDSPLFGGDAVIGLEDRETECPQIDDPVQTLTVDGTPVDSSLLKSFFMDRKLLLATILVPLGIAGGVLVGLVLVRRGIGLGLHGILSLGRAAVSPQPDHRRARVRAHRVVDEDGESLEPTDGSAAGDSGADSKLVDA